MMIRHTHVIGLLSAGLALTACSSYDEEMPQPDHGSVVAQISLSVSGSNTTRMTADATQSDQKFKGMKDISLIPFNKQGTDADPVKSTDRRYGTLSQLTDLAANALHASNNSKLYDEVVLPAGTNAMLIYGRSMATTSGVLTPSGLDGDPAGISFSPVQIVPSVTAGQAASEKGDAIIDYLNTIFNSNWADRTNYPALYGFYEMLPKMKAGSSASVQAFVNEIYDVLKKSATTDYVSNVLKAMLAVDALPAELPEKVTLPSDCQGYPADLGLPEGTAVIEWDETDKKFVAVTTENNLGAMNVNVTKFVKPAELWYRTNSRINTDYESRRDDYETQPTWAGVLDAYAVQNGTVQPETKSVAVRQQMQYAVGRLDMKLTATTTTLKDKEDHEVSISNLAVTGVLVGQQCPVDFLFKSKEGGDAFTVYDSEIATTINATESTHTLVLETQKDEAVNIAVELQNNSDVDIVTGADDQIVPPGCKFYLVGQLSVDGHTNYDANTDAKNRVFCQDYVTDVTFVVGDLKNAYYVIPPLSAAELQLSLGVTKWRMVTPAGIELK